MFEISQHVMITLMNLLDNQKNKQSFYTNQNKATERL